MHTVSRRGFTLIELMVALVLLGIVSAGIYRVLVGNQRMQHAQTQRVDMQQNIRAAAAILPAEFREIAATEGDIYAMSATEVQMRGMRQFGVMCREPVMGVGLAGLGISLFRDLFNGTEFVAGDSILLYYEGDEGTRNDDTWWRASIRAVANATCPAGEPGFSLTLDLSPATALMLNRAGAIPRGGPVRGFVPVRYSLYQSATDGLWYLGLEVPIGSGIQPVVGPLTGSQGLLLRFFNANGVATAARDSVALIEIHVRSQSADRMHSATGTGTGGLTYAVDSITTTAALRNNRRF